MVPGADQSILSIFDESVSGKSLSDCPLYYTSVLMSVLRRLSGFGNFYLCLFIEPISAFGVFDQISTFHHFIVGALDISPFYLTETFLVCKSMIKHIEILCLLFWQMG